MKTVHYHIKVSGLKTKAGPIPIVEFKEIIEDGDEILERIPHKHRSSIFTEDFLAKRNAGKSLKKIWGKWPGDESIDELLNALEEKPH